MKLNDRELNVTAALPPPVLKKPKGAFVLTRKEIDRFLKDLKRTGRSATTIETYRQNLLGFYEFLPPDKQVDGSTLPAWRDFLVDKGYSQHSTNSKTSAVNSLFNFLGERNWQVVNIGKAVSQEEGPELTRTEYLQLLNAAKQQENIQLYLIVKTLACTELTPSDLPLLTREAVNAGIVGGKIRGVDREVGLPAALREDLRSYAMYRGIRSGPVFLNAGGDPYGRTAITRMIGILGSELGLEPGKATPRNIRRLYLSTLADFQRQADAWIAESYANLLNEEETNIGWQVWMPARKEA